MACPSSDPAAYNAEVDSLRVCIVFTTIPLYSKQLAIILNLHTQCKQNLDSFLHSFSGTIPLHGNRLHCRLCIIHPQFRFDQTGTTKIRAARWYTCQRPSSSFTHFEAESRVDKNLLPSSSAPKCFAIIARSSAIANCISLRQVYDLSIHMNR